MSKGYGPLADRPDRAAPATQRLDAREPALASQDGQGLR